VRNLSTVVVGMDFSAGAEKALRSAANLARHFHASLHLVTVVVPPTVYQRVLSPIHRHSITEDELVNAARDRLAAVASSPHLVGLSIQVSIHVGNPFAELIKACRERDASLIVVGAHHHHGVERLVLGSTAERVVRKSPIPVLVARTELPAEPTCVLAPIDFSDPSGSAAEMAIGLARRWMAQLIFLHVIEPIAQTYLWPLDPGAVEVFPAEPGDLAGDWTEFLATLDLRDLRWEQRTAKGEAAAMIHEVADETGADLVVIGTHGRSGLTHALLGSLAERIVRTASLPVLTVQPETSRTAPP
jgi:nucleotide-binding universal stress UspA family protein